MRKPREHGWLNPDGITHHINTRQYMAFHKANRSATCGVPLRQAKRTKIDLVDCMMCLALVLQRERYRPCMPPIVDLVYCKDGKRHLPSSENPWRAKCGLSLRHSVMGKSGKRCDGCFGVQSTH